MKLSDVSIVTEVTYRTAEHETLLSFNNDLDNEIFQLWWNQVGLKLFAKFSTEYTRKHYA